MNRWMDGDSENNSDMNNGWKFNGRKSAGWMDGNSESDSDNMNNGWKLDGKKLDGWLAGWMVIQKVIMTT